MESKDHVARGIGCASLIVAVVAIGLSFWQAYLQQRSYDRSVGKIKAALEIVSTIPDANRMPAKQAGDLPGTGPPDLDIFIRNNLQIRVRNTGDEPIEALRVEVLFVGGANDVPPDTKNVATGPLVLKQCSRKDYDLSGTLAPGQIATLPVSPSLLEQMMLSSNRKAGDKLHIGVFQIRCLGKLVGVSHFDPSDPNVSLKLTGSWVPNDFPPPRVQSYIDAFQPHIAIDDH
jgi:hypothetical protein